MNDDGWSWLARELDKMGPDVPDAVVALVDALRDYIRCMEHIDQDRNLEGISPTSESRAHLERCRVLLKEVEDWEINPSLRVD